METNKESFFNKIDEYKAILKLFLTIFLHPEKVTNYTYLQTKRNKLKNDYVFIGFVTLSISFTLLSLLNFNDGLNKIFKSILNLFVFFLINIPTVLYVVAKVKLKRNNKILYLISLLSILFIFSLIQYISSYLFLYTELYIFYLIAIFVGLSRIIWLCFFLPKRVFNGNLKALKIFITFLITILTNIILTIFTIVLFVPKQNSDYETIIVNDPIFTEVYNEYSFIIEENKKINETLLYINNYTANDIYKKPEIRKIIMQRTNILLLDIDDISKRAEKLKYKKTKIMYDFLLDQLNTIKQINENISLIVDFDFEEIQNRITTNQKKGEEIGSRITKNKNKLKTLEYETKTIDSSLELIQQHIADESIAANTNLNIELKHGTGKDSIDDLLDISSYNLNIINSYNELNFEDLSLSTRKEIMNYLKEIEKGLRKEHEILVESQIIQKDLKELEADNENITTEQEKAQNYITILKNVNRLIRKSIETQNDLNTYYNNINMYIKFRISTLWL